MTIKEIHAKAGSLSDYFGYIILLFCWYLLNNMFLTIQPEFLGATLKSIIDWGLRLLIGPIVLAVVFGGVNERQKAQDVFEYTSFFSSLKSHFWRIFGANLLFIVSFFIVTIIAFLASGAEQQGIEDNKLLLGIISISYSAINLFWFSAIVVERKIFRGLTHSFKTLLFNPIALGIGILWGVIGFADTLVFDLKNEQIPLAINLVRSGGFAVLRVLAVMYALAFYKNVWGRLSRL